MRLKLFLSMWAAIAAVVGLTVVLNDRLDLGDGGDQIVSGPDGTVAPGTGATTSTLASIPIVPAAGQWRVAGRVDRITLASAVAAVREVPTPLTVVSERGFGNGGELTGVTVDGKASTVVWDGGRPFQLVSGGALLLDPVDVVLAGDHTVHLVLGGANHAFAPGTYRLDTPVAVGQAGIATPHDTVTFVADRGSLFEARGDAAIAVSDHAVRFLGPGTVSLGGSLQITDHLGATRTEGALELEVVDYDLTFTPTGDGSWTVLGLVDVHEQG